MLVVYSLLAISGGILDGPSPGIYKLRYALLGSVASRFAFLIQIPGFYAERAIETILSLLRRIPLRLRLRNLVVGLICIGAIELVLGNIVPILSSLSPGYILEGHERAKRKRG